MLIKRLDLLTEFFLWVLIFGITFSNATVEICLVAVVLIFIIKRICLKNLIPPKTIINIFLYLSGSIIFFSFIGSAYSNESFRGFIRFLKHFMLYFAIVEFLNGDKQRIVRIFWVVVFISAFTFLNGILQGYLGFDLLRHRQLINLDYLRRINASFIHPNDFGTYIISVLPMIFCFFAKEISAKRKLLLVLISLLGFYCLIKTYSRGAWLGFVIGSLAYFSVYRKKVFMLIPLVLLIFVILSRYGISRISHIFVMEQNTVWERMQLWKGTWNMIQAHPLLGFGINTFSRYFPVYKPADFSPLCYTHNSYLQMWSEIGIFGLLSFLGLISTVLISAFSGAGEKMKKGFPGFILLGFSCGYLAFLVQAALDTNLYSLVLVTLFWVMTACIVSLNSQIRKVNQT
jgi:putative inorganic carbon (HCO3(-)) transporter